MFVFTRTVGLRLNPVVIEQLMSDSATSTAGMDLDLVDPAPSPEPGPLLETATSA